MSDPELAARAQQAAERLERSWDRWRRLRGLTAEQAQPVSSYVGYSLAEPWGRPRVVFGFTAQEAELLSTLLEQDEGADPRFRQGLLWEPELHTRPGHVPVNGAVSGVSLAEPLAQSAGHDGQQPVPAQANGTAAPDLTAPSEPTTPAAPVGGFEPPDGDLPPGPDSGLAGWTRTGPPPPPRGVLLDRRRSA
jgi:hypothetical protein